MTEFCRVKDNESIKPMDIALVILAASSGGVKTATKFVTPKLVIKATRVGKFDKRDRQLDFRVTIGPPNYSDRFFVKDCLKVKEPFPVKKIQLKFPPKKRVKK